MRSRIVLLLFLAILVTSQRALADECMLVVDDHKVDVGDTIPIPVRIENGVDIGVLDLTLTFNPSLLSAESAEDGAFDSNVVNLEDAGDGRIKVVAYQSANSGLNGSFAVAEITFKALDTGESTLNIEVVTLADASPMCNHINYSIRNGTITAYQIASGRGRSGGGSSGLYITSTPILIPVDAATPAPTECQLVTSTAASTPTQATSPTETLTTKLYTRGIIGFKAVFVVLVIAVLLAALYLVLRRRN